MKSKIASAIAYVKSHIEHGADSTEVKNNAANIYSSSFDEYIKIWEAIKNITADGVEEEPDEIAMQFLSAKMALDRLVELFSDDNYIAETLTELKTSLEIIEDGVAR